MQNSRKRLVSDQARNRGGSFSIGLPSPPRSSVLSTPVANTQVVQLCVAPRHLAEAGWGWNPGHAPLAGQALPLAWGGLHLNKCLFLKYAGGHVGPTPPLLSLLSLMRFTPSPSHTSPRSAPHPLPRAHRCCPEPARAPPHSHYLWTGRGRHGRRTSHLSRLVCHEWLLL